MLLMNRTAVGLTRPSMTKLQRTQFVRFVVWRQFMDARVKPARDVERVVQDN